MIEPPNGPRSKTAGRSGRFENDAIAFGSKPVRSNRGRSSGSPNSSTAPSSSASGTATCCAALAHASPYWKRGRRSMSPVTGDADSSRLACCSRQAKRTTCVAWKMRIPLYCCWRWTVTAWLLVSATCSSATYSAGSMASRLKTWAMPCTWSRARRTRFSRPAGADLRRRAQIPGRRVRGGHGDPVLPGKAIGDVGYHGLHLSRERLPW